MEPGDSVWLGMTRRRYKLPETNEIEITMDERDGDMLSDKTGRPRGGTRVKQNYQKRSLQHD